jgi:hypothetical protein
MAKNSDYQPKPPKIPNAGDKIGGQLDGWVYSEDPQDGRFADKDDVDPNDHASS